MILEETVNKLVRDIVNSVLNVNNTIKAKQNGPRPMGTYADVDFLHDDSIGWDQKVITDENAQDVNHTTQGARNITLSIGFYREGAMDNARKVRTGFARQTVYETLYSADMGLVDRSEVRDISEVFESKWEERAQFDLTLSAVGTDTEIINAILSVTIDGDFQTSGKSIPITVEVNT